MTLAMPGAPAPLLLRKSVYIGLLSSATERAVTNSHRHLLPTSPTQSNPIHPSRCSAKLTYSGNDGSFSKLPQHLLCVPSVQYLLPSSEGLPLQMHLRHLSSSMDWFHVLLFGDLHSHQHMWYFAASLPDIYYLNSFYPLMSVRSGLYTSVHKRMSAQECMKYTREQGCYMQGHFKRRAQPLVTCEEQPENVDLFTCVAPGCKLCKSKDCLYFLNTVPGTLHRA